MELDELSLNRSALLQSRAVALALEIWYTRDEMRAIADSTGWDAHYVGDWGHPRGQMMMEMVRR